MANSPGSSEQVARVGAFATSAGRLGDGRREVKKKAKKVQRYWKNL